MVMDVDKIDITLVLENQSLWDWTLDFEKENRLVINGDTLVVVDGYNPKDIFIVSVSGKKYEFTNTNCIDSSVMIIQSSLYRFGLIGYWFK